MKDRFVVKRYRNIVMIALMTFVYTISAGLLHGLYLDEMLLFFFLDLIFLVLFVYLLERSRMQGKIFGNRQTDYKRIWIGFFFAALIMLAGFFFPEFLKPALISAVMLAGFCPRELALSVGIFFDVILCLISVGNIQELALYCLMTLFGCMLADAVKDRKTQLRYGVIFLCLSAMLPELFYYMAYREIKSSLFFYGLAEGLLLAVFLFFFYQKLCKEKQTEISDKLDDILDSAYPLSKELFIFSKADYRHARRVSETAEKCALLVDADAKVCAAAGFYYRIGVLEIGSMVENGVRFAQRECFPEAVIQIISEYNGEKELPSSVESAIVHMVDGLMKKLEVLREQTGSSEWNEDMVIYQTLNDFSAKGLYDQSGLSMNMFLKIREYLVKEEALL